MLPSDEEARNAILEALYEEKRCSRGSLRFEQLHDKLYIPWPILWFNLDYLEEEQLVLRRKHADKASDATSPLPSTYELTEKGQTVIEHKEEYMEKYPFLALHDNDSD